MRKQAEQDTDVLEIDEDQLGALMTDSHVWAKTDDGVHCLIKVVEEATDV